MTASTEEHNGTLASRMVNYNVCLTPPTELNADSVRKNYLDRRDTDDKRNDEMVKINSLRIADANNRT